MPGRRPRAGMILGMVAAQFKGFPRLRYLLLPRNQGAGYPVALQVLDGIAAVTCEPFFVLHCVAGVVALAALLRVLHGAAALPSRDGMC